MREAWMQNWRQSPGFGQRDVVHVVFEVELLVFHPVGPRRVQRAPRSSLLRKTGERQLAPDVRQGCSTPGTVPTVDLDEVTLALACSVSASRKLASSAPVGACRVPVGQRGVARGVRRGLRASSCRTPRAARIESSRASAPRCAPQEAESHVASVAHHGDVQADAVFDDRQRP